MVDFFWSIFLQIAVIMYLSYLLGSEVKTHFNIDSDLPFLIFSILGILIIIYFISKQSKLL